MLALVGSGEYLPAMEPVDRYLLEQVRGTPRVVCLPTAAGTEGLERISYWSRLGEAHFSKLGAAVEALPVIDQESADKPDYAEKIRQANFVYLSGGKPEYLYHTLLGSQTWSAILEVLERGGVVAGCSAGAMIMAERMPGFPGLKPAFGLVKGVVIMPHFDEIPKTLVSTLRLLVREEYTLLGIEGNTALVGSGSDFRVLGSGCVEVWQKGEKSRYTAGQQVSW